MKEKCYYCDSEDVLFVHEHYVICYNCDCAYTVLWKYKIGCEHINEDTPTLLWSIDNKDKDRPYLTEFGRCYSCAKLTHADVW